MNMTRYEMTKINFIETIPWSSLHLYFDIWHLISPSELLRRGPKWRKLTSLWPIHEIKFTTFICRDLTSYFAIIIATARSKNDQSWLHYEPSFTLCLRTFPSAFTRFCLLHTTFSSGNVVFHGLKQKSRTENTTDGGQMVSIIPTRTKGGGSTIMLCWGGWTFLFAGKTMCFLG